jgi:cytoskeleton protein RodZ
MAVEAGGIGARLRAGREKLGLTVLQVAERMHTDPKVVEAIEAEKFEALGAPVYARGHIRHYAELVGESAAELIAVYADSNKAAQPDLTRIVKAPAGSDSNKLVAPALVVIAVFAVAGAVWWVSALSKKKPQLSETHLVVDELPPQASAAAGGPESAVTPALAAQAPPPGSPQAKPGMSPGGAMAMQPRPPGSAGAAGAAARSAAGSGAGSGAPTAQSRTGAATSGSAVLTGATAPTGAATAATSSAAAAPLVPHSKSQAQVTLHYSADSWTEVYDASGARLFYDVGAANSVQTVVGTPPLRVVLGNAAGVAVEFNGHSTPIANLAHADGSVQFSINRSGRVVRAKPSADGG